jgi:diaminopropionate ammonia-lyase
VTATDGNHGRAVARAARWFGLGAHVLVPAGTAAARIDGIRSEGARVTVVGGTYDDAVAAAAARAGDRALVVSDTSWDGYTTVPAWVIEGYGTIFAEVAEQHTGDPIDLVVVQVGVGALGAAAIHHLGATAEVIAVEPVDAACALAAAEAGGPVTVAGPHRSIMAGLNCGTVSPLAWPALATGVDVFVAIDDAPVEQAMRDLAAIGVVAGETGASGLAGLRELVTGGRSVAGRHALVLNTEGATDPEGYARIVGTVGHPDGYLP